jgi:hypothetical protein
MRTRIIGRLPDPKQPTRTWFKGQTLAHPGDTGREAPPVCELHVGPRVNTKGIAAQVIPPIEGQKDRRRSWIYGSQVIIDVVVGCKRNPISYALTSSGRNCLFAAK